MNLFTLRLSALSLALCSSLAMAGETPFYRGGQDNNKATAPNGAVLNADYLSAITHLAQGVEVLNLRPGLHVIRGYHLVNTIVVDGKTGLIVIDTGTKFGHIPFQGAAPARTALLGKVIDTTMANVDEAVVFRTGSPWRILGVMSDARSPVAPELPTFKEVGYDIQAGSMRGFPGPKGMPAEATAKFTAAIKACTDDATFKDRAAKSYLPIRYLAPAEYVQSLQKLDTSLRDLWKVKPWNQ